MRDQLIVFALYFVGIVFGLGYVIVLGLVRS